MKSRDGYRFGISEFTTWPWPFEHDVKRYATHGVDAIEVCEFKLQGSDYARALLNIARHGLSVSSVQTTVHSLFPDSLAPHPTDPAERLDAITRSIRRLAPHVPHGTPFVVITGAAPSGDYERVRDHASGAFSRLADTAESFGMRIAFEPLNPVLCNTDTAIWRLDDALDLVTRIDHPALGLCVDLWNIFQTPNVERVIRACARRIFLVQVSDWRWPRAHADRVSIGDGTIPLSPLLEATRDARYSGPYVLEIFSDEKLSDSLWKSDLDHVIDRNIIGFERVWQPEGALR